MNNKITQMIVLIATLIFGINNLVAHNADVDANSASRGVIRLVGQLHNIPEHIQVKNNLIKRAEAGDIILVRESRSFGEDLGPNMFGMEEESSEFLLRFMEGYIGIVLVQLVNKLDDDVGYKSLIIEKLKPYFDQYFNPAEYAFQSLFDALKLFKDKPNFFKRNEEIILAFFDALAKNGGDGNKMAGELLKGHTFERPFLLKIHENLSQWINLYADIVSLYNKKSSYNKEVCRDLKKLAEQLLKIDEISAIHKKMKYFDVELLKPLMFEHRDAIFLENIGHILENNKAREFSFYVVVGGLHVPALYNGLKLKGYQVELAPFAAYIYNVFLADEMGFFSDKSLQKIMGPQSSKLFKKFLNDNPSYKNKNEL